MPNKQAKRKKWLRRKRHDELKKRRRQMRMLKKTREAHRNG